MADNRKYYYLKLKENYFDEDAIVLLESDQYYSLLWSLSGSYSQCHPDPCGGSDAPFKLCLFRPVHSGVTAV